MTQFKHTKSALTYLAVVAALSVNTGAQASKELAQKNACLACHGIEKKVVGPAFNAIAGKYKDQKDAQAILVKSIKTGGSGKWGAIPMPAQANLSDADAGVLANWILAGSK